MSLRLSMPFHLRSRTKKIINPLISVLNRFSRRSCRYRSSHFFRVACSTSAAVNLARNLYALKIVLEVLVSAKTIQNRSCSLLR